MDKGEFYLLKGINETIYKVVIILLMCFFLGVLGFTAYEFYSGNYSEEKLFWHKFMGTMLILIMPVHMIIKKNKIKKLSQEFISVLLKRDIKHTNNKEELLDAIKKKTLKEISTIFRIDFQILVSRLKNNQITISNEDIQLKDIAKENAKDIYQLFILILTLHVKSSSPKKG